MDTHVKVLGVLNIVSGALGVCVAVIMAPVLGGYGLWVLFSKDTERLFATPQAVL